MTITHTGKSTINLDTVCHFELGEKKIMFFFTAMTARTNWEFESQEEASRVYETILEKIGTVNIGAEAK